MLVSVSFVVSAILFFYYQKRLQHRTFRSICSEIYRLTNKLLILFDIIPKLNESINRDVYRQHDISRVRWIIIIIRYDVITSIKSETIKSIHAHSRAHRRIDQNRFDLTDHAPFTYITYIFTNIETYDNASIYFNINFIFIDTRFKIIIV